MIWQPAVTLVNARVVTDRGTAGSVRFTSRILALDEPARPGDAVVDVRESLVLPGLVNAHDHLELNHYGRLKIRDRYCNASAWIEDMRPRLAADAAIREARSRPLADRLFIGALKNLLSGVTMVAHHNPFYRELRRGMPVRVLRTYGWAHSFLLQARPAGARGERGGDVQDRFRSTPAGTPFFVHLGEGIDAAAGGELRRLESLGCLAANTVLVHGVAIDADGWRRIARAGAGVVWCPASNVFLFGQTIDPDRLGRDARLMPSHVRSPADAPSPGEARRRAEGATAARYEKVAIGTDSRLTGSRDLLEELRIAYETSSVPPERLLAMVTGRAAAMIRQPSLGRIAVGAPADLLVVPHAAGTPARSLLATARRDVELVTIGGRPLVADPALADVFRGRRFTPRLIHVDEAPKVADPALARRIAECPIAEPGVTVP